MTQDRKAAVTVGALFILTTLAYGMGDGIIQAVFAIPDFLDSIPAYRSQLVIAALLQILCGFGVVWIAVAIYPVFNKHSTAIAIWYIANRVIECALIVISTLRIISLLSVGNSTSLHQPVLETMATSHYHFGFLLLCIVLSFGALPFYYLLYRSSLVPRFISVWGMLAVLCMLTGNLIDMLGYGTILPLYYPMGFNELFLGSWLIAKGFDRSRVTFA